MSLIGRGALSRIQAGQCCLQCLMFSYLLQVHHVNERQRRKTGLQVVTPHGKILLYIGGWGVFQVHLKFNIMILNNFEKPLFVIVVI